MPGPGRGAAEEAAAVGRVRALLGADEPSPWNAAGLLNAAVALGTAPMVQSILRAGRAADGPFLPALPDALWAALDADAAEVVTVVLDEGKVAWPGSHGARIALARTVRLVGEEGPEEEGGGGGGGGGKAGGIGESCSNTAGGGGAGGTGGEAYSQAPARDELSDWRTHLM